MSGKPFEAASAEAAVLRTLAETLDVFQTLQRFPDMSAVRLRRILLRAAERLEVECLKVDRLEDVEPPPKKPAPEPGGKWQLFSDGASRGNPGPAGAGYLLIDPSGRVVREAAAPLGRTTNNVAEYRALLLGLEDALRLGVKRLSIRMDSELIVRQLTGRYRVKSPHLVGIYSKVTQLLGNLDAYDVAHVMRSENAAADALANKGADAVEKK
ncbi:MAG: ribonuclease HI family protein [Pseudomonadota bacterium]